MDCVGCDKCRLWGKLQVRNEKRKNELSLNTNLLLTCFILLFIYSIVLYLCLSTDTRSRHCFENSVFGKIECGDRKWVVGTTAYRRESNFQAHAYGNCSAIQCIWQVKRYAIQIN